MAAALVALLPFVSPPFLVIALAVLGLRLSLMPGRPAPYELFVATINAVSLPFVAGSIWPALRLPILLVIPGLPWLDAALRRAAASLAEDEVPPTTSRDLLRRLPGGRSMSPYLAGLTLGLLLQVLIGIVVTHAMLLGTALVLLGFLGVLVVTAYLRIPHEFLAIRTPTVRVLARDTVETAVPLASRARSPIRIVIEEPHTWTRIFPEALTLAGEEREIRLRLTPRLAGPSRISARVTAIDPWGLTMTHQWVDLAHLRVIPRAAYAAWLARRYLEQARGGGSAAVTVSEAGRMGSVRRGLDYYGARLYEPGDILRDVFWKHTWKLNQLVVKERRDEHGEAVIIATNLSARDAEEADWLGYSVLMSTLTLASEGVPLAFAAYTAQDIVAATPPLTPRTAVRHALGLIERIRIAPMPVRVLEPSQIVRLRRDIGRLAAGGTEPAMRLARILSFEHQARLYRAQAHPASAALRRAASQVIAPTSVLVISSTHEEVDALEVTLERLQRKGFHTVFLHSANGRAVEHMPLEPPRFPAVVTAG